MFSYTTFFYINSSAHSPSAETNRVKPACVQVETSAILKATADHIPIYVMSAMRHFENLSHDTVTTINRKRKLVDDDVIATNQKKVRRDYGLPVQFTAKVPKYQECLGVVSNYEDSFHNNKRHI